MSPGLLTKMKKFYSPEQAPVGWRSTARSGKNRQEFQELTEHYRRTKNIACFFRDHTRSPHWGCRGTKRRVSDLHVMQLRCERRFAQEASRQLYGRESFTSLLASQKLNELWYLICSDDINFCAHQLFPCVWKIRRGPEPELFAVAMGGLHQLRHRGAGLSG